MLKTAAISPEGEDLDRALGKPTYSRMKQPRPIILQQQLFNLIYLHHLVAKMVDDLDSDAARGGFVERT